MTKFKGSILLKKLEEEHYHQQQLQNNPSGNTTSWPSVRMNGNPHYNQFMPNSSFENNNNNNNNITSAHTTAHVALASQEGSSASLRINTISPKAQKEHFEESSADHNDGDQTPTNRIMDLTSRRSPLVNMETTNGHHNGDHQSNNHHHLQVPFNPHHRINHSWEAQIRSSSTGVASSAASPASHDGSSVSVVSMNDSFNNGINHGSSSAHDDDDDDLSETDSNSNNSLSFDGKKRKRKSHPIPEDCKDNAYWERRKRNNESAKRSRELRRIKEHQTSVRVVILEQDNLKLRTEVDMLRGELEKLRDILYNRNPNNFNH